MVDFAGWTIPSGAIADVGEAFRPPIVSDNTSHPGAFTSFVMGKSADFKGDLEWHKWAPLTQEHIGYIEHSYFTMYYNRIWMLPGLVDFGPVTTDAYRDVYIWNAHLRQTTITEILHPADRSIGISGITLPLRMHPLQSVVYRVEVSPDGEPSIDGTFTFIADPTETTRVRVTGMRSRIWPFPPNWNEPYEINYEMRSEILTSRSGKEQRISLRQSPRKSYRFSALVHDERFRAFLRHMNAWQQRSTVMPEYSRLTRLSQPVADGSISIIVDEVPDWLAPGRLVSMFNKSGAIVRSVEAIIGNTVTLASAISGDWPAKSRLYAAEVGRLSPNISASQHTNITSTVQVDFKVTPGTEYMPAPVEPMRMYRDREVFLKRPNWGTPLSPEFQAVIEEVDFGVGRVDYFLPVQFNTRISKAEFIGVSRTDIQEYVDFFRRQFGQTGEFYMPTFTHDVNIKVAAQEGSSTIRIAGTDFFDDYGQSSIYRDIAIFMKTGEILTYRARDIFIVDDADGRDTAILTDGVFPSEISNATTRQICWMPLWRLMSDGLTVQHVTTTAANISMAMKTLEEDL